MSAVRKTIAGGPMAVRGGDHPAFEVVGGVSVRRQGQTYRRGALTTYADPGELEAWLGKALPGEEMTYAIGHALNPRAETKRLALQRAEAGEAFLFRERVGSGWNYCIRKLSAPAQKHGAKGQVIRIDAAFLATPEGRLLDVLSTLAAEGCALPSYAELAELAGLSCREVARYRLKLLEKAGKVRLSAANGVRSLEIVASGVVLCSAIRGEAK